MATRSHRMKPEDDEDSLFEYGCLVLSFVLAAWLMVWL